MEIFNLFSVYIILGTYFLITDAEIGGLNLTTEVSETPHKDKVLERKTVHKQNKLKDKEKIDSQPLTQHTESKGKLNEKNVTPKRKSTQIPLNIIIDTKPRTIPIKIPLVIKTGNVKPAPAHYVRLKGDTYKKHSKNKSEINSNPKKTTSKEVQVPPKNKMKSKSGEKSFPKYRSKGCKYYVDERDRNDTHLLQELKSANRRKQEKLENKKNTKIANIPKKGKATNETHTTNEANYFNKVDSIEKAKNSIFLTKLPVSVDQVESKANDTHDLQGNMTETLVIPFKDLEILSIPTSDMIMPVTVNDSGLNVKEATTLPDDFESDFKGSPLVSVDPGNDSFESITINDHKYQEIEERGVQPNPEQMSAGEIVIEPLASETLNDPYDSFINNYQNENKNNLKYLTESNLAFDSEENFYPQGNLIAPFHTYPQDVPQVFSPPVQRLVQDVYGPNSQSNVINISPENYVGRIWRTWRDTQIKINKPMCSNNRSLGRNSNHMMYNGLNAKTPSLFHLQQAGLGKCYNNLPYPYSCQFY